MTDDTEYLFWLDYGIEKGWISTPSCGPHEGWDITKAEADAMDDGYDECVDVVRLWGPEGDPEAVPPPWANAHLN